jgi:predicted TPR repeat methyltransferase
MMTVSAMEDRPTSEMFLSLDQAMAIAVQLHRTGHLDDAAELYRQILEQKPEYGPALHYSGVLAHQQGRSDEAVARLERSLEIDPDQADCYSNLCIVLREQGKLDEAVDACRHALAIDPAHANAQSNLGGLLRAQGHVADAEAAYRAAIALNPDHVDAYTNLGNLLNAQKRTREAVECFCKAITLNPAHAESRRLLGLAYCTLGEIDKAVEVFERWVEEEPENPVPRHMLAACSGRDVPARASDAYVESVFDTFASSFDSRLARLSYRAPALVTEMVARAGLEPANALDVLDAGCGTGLCGPLLAPYARRLVGVDLSGNMLAQARERHVYDELIKGELTAYLRDSRDAFDVIVSADTLVYFGLLDDVVAAAAQALRPGGLLVFTLEEIDEAEAPAGYRIKPHGRYGHARAYVERVLTTKGLRPEIERAALRMEGGVPVDGLVVRATRVGDSHA